MKPDKKDKYLKKKYGISLEEYNSKLAEQKDCCAMCGKHKSNHHSKNENYISAWLGRKHSTETRNKISASLSKLVGDKSPRAKKVICTLSGRIFGCAKDASTFLNMNYGTLKSMLNGGNPNKTTFKYLEV